MSRTEEKRAAFSLAPWKRLWRCVCQHRFRLALAIGSNLLLAVADFTSRCCKAGSSINSS